MGEKVDDVLHKLDSWCNAYPENLFPEPDRADLNWLHETRRGLCDRISASMGRHMVKHMREMADAIREEVAQHERIVAGLEADVSARSLCINDLAAQLAEAKKLLGAARDVLYDGKLHSPTGDKIDAFLAQTAEGV